MGFVYKITNILTDKKYIGLTTRSLEERFRKHLFDAFDARRKNAIHYALRKYGKKNFVIEAIFESNSLNELNDKENYFIQKYDTLYPNGYNLIVGGGVRIVSEITKNRMRKAQLGKKQSKKTRKKRSDSLKGKPQKRVFVNKRAKSICKPIMELTTGLTFNSIKESAKYFNISSRCISKNLHNQSVHYFGKKFIFLDKGEFHANNS